jgi:ABC-2 type transport system ATP-binding protein
VTTIEIDGLTKRFGSVLAVDDLRFGVPEGAVTGLLGPNGAGKTTTLRMLLGLVSPTAGTATIGGVAYARLTEPGRTVGAVLEASSFHPARTARDHLRVVASAARIPTARVDEMLEQVGLAGDATRRVGGYSLGMRQRLGLATALLGNPAVLVLDEPTNGLDPAGVRWLRDLIRSLSREGRTILVSSHLLAEVAQTVDHVVIIDRGRLVTAAPLAELATSAQPGVAVRTPDTAHLRTALTAAGIAVNDNGPDRIVALGASPEAVGRAVAAAGVVVYEMSLVGGSLEDAFLRLTTPEEITQ